MIHHGIVLRCYKFNQKVSILDKDLGRIDGIVRKKGLSRNLFTGAYISYVIDQWRNQYIIKEVELIQIPASWVKDDLLFLHHVLEICYFFSPHNSCASDVFNLFELLYQDDIVLDSVKAKKIYVCDLFKQLGIYSPNTMEYDISFIKFILSPLKKVYHINIDNKLEEKIQKWLLECMADNSYSIKLKTLSFLKK